MPGDVSKELQELFAEAGPPEAPKDLGNIPDEVRAESPEAPAEPPPPVEPPPAEEPAPEPAAPADPPVDDAASRIAALEQELAFVRAGQQAQATQQQAPPIPTFNAENILPFTFSASDLERLGFNATPENVEQINNALRLVALSSKEAAKQELRAEYQQGVAIQQSGQTLRQAFYAANPDLEPYADIVGVYATQVHQQNPTAQAGALMAETARRTRERLAQMGVAAGTTVPQAAPTQRVARQRIKPATSESGAATRGNGATKLTTVEKDILQMMQAG